MNINLGCCIVSAIICPTWRSLVCEDMELPIPLLLCSPYSRPQELMQSLLQASHPPGVVAPMQAIQIHQGVAGLVRDWKGRKVLGFSSS